MKQIKKLSLSNVISKLTRNEMRYVMAGSGGDTECLLAKFNAYNDAKAAGFSTAEATSISWSTYYTCMGLTV